MPNKKPKGIDDTNKPIELDDKVPTPAEDGIKKPSDAAVVGTFSAILKAYGERRVIKGDLKTVYKKIKAYLPLKFHKSEVAVALKFLECSKQIIVSVSNKMYGGTSGAPKQTIEGYIPVLTPQNIIKQVNVKQVEQISGFVRKDNHGYYLEPLGSRTKTSKRISFVSDSDAKNHLDKLVAVTLYDRISNYDAIIKKTLEGEEYVSKLIAMVMGLAFNHGINLNPDQQNLNEIAAELAEIPTKVLEDDPNDKWSIANMKNEFSNFQDLRHLPFFTIDPATCLDMDDSVCVVKNPDGSYTEYVAISLVSVYIKTFGALFNAAYEKGNSSYIADFVDPMMREKLSNIIGSLNAGEDRLAFITKIDYDQDGNILNESMFPGVMRSRHKFAYETVDKIVSGDRTECKKYPEEILQAIKALRELEDLIRPRRQADGSTNFATREYTSRLTEDRNGIKEQFADNSTKAHEMIETAMLTANEVFARFAIEHEIPIIYRVEDQISDRQIDEIRAFLGKMGVPFNLPEESESHAELQNAINEAVEVAQRKKGDLFAQVVSEGIIKCLPKARYDVHNVGHFALNFDAYAHTTSPIRRFADFVNQKQILAYMAGKPLPFTEQQLADICAHINYTERNSAELELEVQELLNAWNIDQKLKNHEDLSTVGYISKLDKEHITVTTDYGHVVIDLASGGRNGTFEISKDRLTIINTQTHKKYYVGQEINVKPTHVDIATSTIKATQEFERGDSQYMKELNAFFKTSPDKRQSSLLLWNQSDIPESKNRPLGLHDHTLKSDGRVSWLQLLSNAANNNYAYIAAADHNYINFSKLKEVFGVRPADMANAYLPLDASVLGKKFTGQVLKYVNACEFTVYDTNTPNKKGNPTKYHFLVVAPKLDTMNNFLRLLAIKRQNDIDHDLARIEYIFRYRGVQFPAEKVNEFRHRKYLAGKSIKRFTPELAKEFFDTYPDIVASLGLNKSVIHQLIDAVPDVKKLFVPADLVVKLAHECGAFVLVAHPAKNLTEAENLNDAIKSLIKMRVDGFNLKEADDVAINSAIRYYCSRVKRKDPMINDGGGNDRHSLHDYQETNHEKFTEENSPVACQELENLQIARSQGKISHRRLPKMTDNEKAEVETILHELETDYSWDSYNTFVEAADEILQTEKLKTTFAFARYKKNKSLYLTKEILPVLQVIAKSYIQPEAIDFLKANKVVTIKDLKSIIQGEFNITENQVDTVKSDKRFMVSKVASTQARRETINKIKTKLQRSTRNKGNPSCRGKTTSYHGRNK